MGAITKIYDAIMTKQIFGSLLVILFAGLLISMFNKVISKILITGKTAFEIKRRKTIIKLFQSIFKYLIFMVAILIILDFYGVDTKSLIASLGVVGVVIGLALQDTVKDFISGVSLILENYLAVGDIVTFNDFTGEVIELGLRTTKIKKASGEVMIIANRNIDTIINSSQKKANLLLEIDTAYEVDSKLVKKVLEQVINKAKKEDLIFADSSYLGINDLGASSVKYLINIHCDQTKKMVVKREILERIKIAYEKNNIKIPYNQIEVHHGEDI
ncbi:MAG: mechanosensitive ion channel family protein [Ruminococcus sp.]|nr:mechanosensitive ion channel family protein [Ruminococcus sp.]